MLSGRRSTTHWASLDRLRALKDVTVVEERFVRDPNVWSSAGVAAGIDLMLAFIGTIASEEAFSRWRSLLPWEMTAQAPTVVRALIADLRGKISKSRGDCGA